MELEALPDEVAVEDPIRVDDVGSAPRRPVLSEVVVVRFQLTEERDRPRPRQAGREGRDLPQGGRHRPLYSLERELLRGQGPSRRSRPRECEREHGGGQDDRGPLHSHHRHHHGIPFGRWGRKFAAVEVARYRASVADDLAGRSQTVLAQRREARRRAIRRRRILLASAGLAVAAAGVAYASLGGSGGSTKPRVAVLRPE